MTFDKAFHSARWIFSCAKLSSQNERRPRRQRKGDTVMKNVYVTPEIQMISVSSEDIISTSPTIELPWLPVEDEI